MEEKKLTKEVKMNAGVGNKAPQEEQTPLTTEQLKDVAEKLWEENRYLKQRLEQAIRTINAMNRLDYLFKVLELGNFENKMYGFDSDFVEACVKEIQELLTIKEEPQQEEDTKKD